MGNVCHLTPRTSRSRLDGYLMLAQQMKRTRTIITLALTTYLALYAVARKMHVLVMYDGYHGSQGVDVADLGPVPNETVIVCAVARVAFWPLMQVETIMRKGLANQASHGTVDPGGSTSREG